MKIRYLFMVMLLAVLPAVMGCGGGETEQADVAEEELAAKVEDWSLTRAQLEEAIAQLPPTQKKKYDSPRGRVELVNLYIQDQLFYKEAQRLELDKDPAVELAIENTIKRVMVNEYYKQYVNKRATPTDDEIRDYYELHQDDFTSLPIVKARHLFAKKKEKIFEMKSRIDAGEKMTTLTHKFSEDDITKKDGGDLGYFNPGGYIRFVGYSDTFSDAVFDMEPGVISDPIKWEKGWSIVYVVEKEPEKLKPLSEARPEIVKVFRSKRIDLAQAETVAELRERFTSYNYLEAEHAQNTRSAEELWNLAQTTTDPRQRLIAYEEIVERHPGSPYVPQALFMVGFVFAEELKDNVGADRAFNKVLELFPGTDVAKSAEWMLKNLNKPLPDFEDLDFDEVQQKISDESDDNQ